MIPGNFYIQRINQSGDGYVETNLTALARELSKNYYFRDIPTFTQTTGYSYVETGTVTGLQVTGYGTGENGNINFTGYEFFSQPFYYKIENLNTFSGYNFKGDIRTEGLFSQSQVNLGLDNRNFSGSKANMLGLSNNASSAPQTKSYILGGSNNLNKSDNSNVFGFNNKIDSADLSISIGDSNQTINSKYNNLNLGFSNLISGLNNSDSADTYNIGWANKSVDTSGVKVFGEANSIKSVKDALVLGENIFLEKSDQINAIGKDLSIKQAFYDTVIGTNNILDYTYKNTLLGIDSEIFDSSKVYLVGENNLSTGDDSNCIFGRDNESTLNKESHIIGDDNLISNSNNLNFFGNFSEIKGLTDSTAIGEVNNLNDSFGITVIGKANNITGLLNGIIVGEYNTQGNLNTGSNVLPGTGLAGKNLYVFGRSNNGKNNENLFTFGESNIGLDSDNSYIIGNENIASKAFNSYVFGQNNSISGSQNYVIGNNNIVRSGDSNSILIGISHEFTGAFKVASINIASVDSKIEVSPNEVKINSPSRIKFNDQNIAVASDLNNFLNSSNGLANSGSFESYIINDPNYTTLADQIQLQSFAYSGREDRYYGKFSGFNESSQNAYNFTGFFRKQPALFYGGLHSIYGNDFYQSNNQDFEILFSRDIEPITGNWIISPKSSLGLLFYNRSTNTGIFPVSNWITTGSVNITKVTGYNPAPSFQYSSSFTGFSPNQKINSSTLYSSNYFNNFGIVTYPSAQDDIAVLYGAHTDPKNDPSWLIIDKYSSGVYYINKSVPRTTTPQTGWIATGYMGYTGRNPQDLTNALSGIQISLGTRSGIISSYDATYGRIYIPFLY